MSSGDNLLNVTVGVNNKKIAHRKYSLVLFKKSVFLLTFENN